MKSTYVDGQGNVRCPACGAVNSFTVERTGKKAKWAAGLTIGLGALAMPKRLKCKWAVFAAELALFAAARVARPPAAPVPHRRDRDAGDPKGYGTNLKRSGSSPSPGRPIEPPPHSDNGNAGVDIRPSAEWQLLAAGMAEKHGLVESVGAGFRYLRLADDREIGRYAPGSAKIEVRFSNAREVARSFPGMYASVNGEYVRAPVSTASRWEELIDQAIRRVLSG
jgi:hypothetical protein